MTMTPKLYAALVRLRAADAEYNANAEYDADHRLNPRTKLGKVAFHRSCALYQKRADAVDDLCEIIAAVQP